MGAGVNKGRTVDKKVREVREGRSWQDFGKTWIFTLSKKASGGVILVDLCFNRIVLTATLKLDSKETRTEQGNWEATGIIQARDELGQNG